METTSIKLEPDIKQEAEDYEKQFLKLVSDYPDGVTQEFLLANLPGISRQQLLKVMNDLESKNRLETLQSKNKKLVWRLRSKETADKMSSLNMVERVVFTAIVSTKDQGATVAHLRSQTRINQKELQRILKVLQDRKEIKAIKAKTGRTKIYFSFDVTPDAKLTTLSPFMDSDGLDQDFVEILSQECIAFLERRNDLAKNKTEGPLVRRNASYASAEEIQQYIVGMQISKVKLSVADVAKLLDALVLEGRLECSAEVRSATDSDTAMDVDLDEDPAQISSLRYRISSSPPIGALAKVPCGVCPVRRDCRVGGIISPESCVYMKEWLSF